VPAARSFTYMFAGTTRTWPPPHIAAGKQLRILAKKKFFIYGVTDCIKPLMDGKGKVHLCPVIPDIPNSIAFRDLGCRRDVGKICGVLGPPVACSDKSLPTFRAIHFFGFLGP
jgi:hypothetical protein